jgi:RimJ/RimL family protein N-acetyltransferase
MSAASSSKTLRAKIDLALSSARPQEFWGRADANLVTQIQLRNYDVVRASVRLMLTARHNCQSFDPVGQGMAPYLDRHVDEERDHARWLSEDLWCLGYGYVANRQTSALAAELVGAQHYWIYYAHPVALLGYMAVLEGCTASVDSIEAFIERTGYPREALRTLLHHAKVDPGHSADLDDLIDSLPLTQRHVDLMGLSAIHTATKLMELSAEAGRG